MLKLYSSSTNDSDDDSGEEDVIWDSYRKQMKSQSLSSSTDSQESFDTVGQDVTSYNQSTIVDAEPLEDIQSWAQMLQEVTSSVQSVTLPAQQQVTSLITVSSSSELEDTTPGDVLSNGGPLGKPPIVNKFGKKAKVRKHAKKKKKTQDEQKRETFKHKQKDKGIVKEQFQDSEPCVEVKPKDDSNSYFTDTMPDDKVTLTQNQDHSEDINKIKMRLEAQISGRKGFGVLPSQEVVYDKVCT